MAVGGDRDGASLSDEEWERFLRESMEGSANAPREPSAQARSVGSRPGEGLGQPDGWRTYTPPAPRRRKGWYVAGFVASVALLVVAVAPERVAGWFGSGSQESQESRPLAPETGDPGEAPPMEPAERPTLAEPFKGSPAARWASGAAGITVPEARATGWMSAPQVAQALERSRDFLVASNLDPAVLTGSRPEKAITLINPHQRDVQDFLRVAFRTPDEKNDPLLLFSRFQSSQVHLVGDVVKTRGQLTYREGERGAVHVTGDVTFVYPVTPAEGGDQVVRTIVRREVVMSWDDPADVITESGTFSLVSYKLDMTNGGCDTHNGFLTPTFGNERPSTGGAPPVDPYDRSRSFDERMASADGGCGVATRS
ncbi:hypothetical protein ACFW2Y_04980 [Streptomyces sp. NPDC058877]|uniref:hypothetical protein n=1 Tax=unclassified Streptomyces TaxID=2593676 RepID=UPI0036B03B7F